MEYDVLFSVMCVISVLVAVAKIVLQVSQGIKSVGTTGLTSSHTAEEWYDMDSDAFMKGQMQSQREVQETVERAQHHAGQNFLEWNQQQDFQRFVDESMDFSLKSVTPFEMGGFEMGGFF